ncbi:hypothetical protein ACSFBM_27870 [Variovorax sp. GB1R11]|uniref:hypothetical protein n=1 Tax=Variovorax sp. GB1R11 TaxID=3443741 RepID=UPI003F48135C
MTKTLTRTELYELVWTRPRSTLAKDLGISDVAIGKLCVRSHIPGPPPGYWARKAAGKAGRRPPLPIRLPGHSIEVTFGDRGYGSWPVGEDLNQSIAAPEFAEQIDEQVAAAMKIIGKVVACRDLSSPHSALKRVLDAEARRRQKAQERGWTFDKPRFDGPQHQRQLKIFNSIARALAPVTTGLDVLSQDEWIQGVGTLHFLKMNLHFGGARLGLLIIEPDVSNHHRRALKSKKVDATTLRLGAESGPLDALEWTDKPGEKLESQLPTIIQGLLVRAELSMRTYAQFAHEHRVKRRIEIAKEQEAAERARETKRLEEIAAHRQKAREHIINLGKQRRAALDIREMVGVLSAHPELGPEGNPQFDDWVRLALDVADELDPMKRPLQALISDAGAVPAG